MTSNNSVRYERASGAAIRPWIEGLARLRIEVFREFPYLYEGSEDYEREYLRTYVDSARSLAMLVFGGDRLVGATTGLPMADEDEDVRRPFIDAGMDAGGVFYCGESILLPAWRGRGIYRVMFEARENHARALGGFHTAAFCCVQRPKWHPRRPKGYQPLDEVWRHFGYAEHPELHTEFSWKDIDEPRESPKPMRFWTKALA